MNGTMLINSSGFTDIGCVRTNNEDSILVEPELSLYLVADGMGGSNGGEIASAMTAEVVLREIKGRHEKIASLLRAGTVEGRNAAKLEVSQSIVIGCKEIFARSRAEADLAGMGTTVVLLLSVDDHAIVAHVGDSRAYQLRGDQCNQLTEDHTLLQDHLRHGLISAEDAKVAKWGNVISRAVGTHPSVKVDTMALELMVGDTYVLCSDGLHGYLSDGELPEVIAGLEQSASVKRLIDLAKERGGKDNVSVVHVHVSEAKAKPEALPVTENKPRPETSTADDKLKALQSIPLFSSLEYKELVNILTIFSVRQYAAGQDVIVEGTPGDELFVVLTGAVEIKKAGKVVTTLRQRSHFGEMAMVDNDRRSATATAVEASRLMVIHRNDFVALAHRDPAVGIKLLWAFVASLSRRLRRMTDPPDPARPG